MVSPSVSTSTPVNSSRVEGLLPRLNSSGNSSGGKGGKGSTEADSAPTEQGSDNHSWIESELKFGKCENSKVCVRHVDETMIAVVHVLVFLTCLVVFCYEKW